MTAGPEWYMPRRLTSVSSGIHDSTAFLFSDREKKSLALEAASTMEKSNRFLDTKMWFIRGNEEVPHFLPQDTFWNDDTFQVTYHPRGKSLV
jgi:hypothetical protein